MSKPEQSGSNSPISSRHMQEKQWVRNVREEESREDFEKIFRRYYKPLHGFAFSYVKQAQQAEDIVQSVFLNIWAQRKSWNPPGTVKHYLFVAVRNEALNIIRHDQVVDDAEEEVVQRFRELKQTGPIDLDPDIEELQKAIQKGIERLPDQSRKIFLLSRRSGLTYSEIAEVLDISINTVGTQMGRALKYLRNHLSDYMGVLTAAKVATMFFQTLLILLLIFHLW